MYGLSVRFLRILSLVLVSASVLGADIDGHALYGEIAPQLAGERERLQTACSGGDTRACAAMRDLDKLLHTFDQSDANCQAGNAAACRELGMGVGVLVVGANCQAGDATACAQLQHIKALAPDCDAGDAAACEEIEFALFGTPPPDEPLEQGPQDYE